MDRAFIVGISDYPIAAWKLPAVAADVREIGKLLSSARSTFRGGAVDVLADGAATRASVSTGLKSAFLSAGMDDTVFVYVAGHGTVVNDAYYFVTHDADPAHLAATAIPLADMKRLFDGCRSRRVFLWLDFCHSGGIIPRRLSVGAGQADADNAVIARALQIVQGQGKLIFAACTPEQSAFEDSRLGHGLFTAYLLIGLGGEAASGGEVTASSLYDYIDRQMGSNRQRPMMFGQMTGRVILMHHAGSPKPSAAPTPAAKPTPPPTPKGRKKQGQPARPVSSSGEWCMLGDDFFRTSAVRRDRGGQIVAEIPSQSADTDAALARLRPQGFGGQARTGFAHLNDATFARVQHVESVSAGGKQVWTVTLQPEQSQHGGPLSEMAFQSTRQHYSADDIARLRAGRILLNDPPARSERTRAFDHDSTLEGFIRGIGTPVQTAGCTILSVHEKYGSSPHFLQLARLACVFHLKVSGVVEHVQQFDLGPVRQGRVTVSFRGQRARWAVNAEPATISLEGECPLGPGV